MVGSLVRFLFTRCKESQTQSFASLTRSFSILHNSEVIHIYFLFGDNTHTLYITYIELGKPVHLQALSGYVHK